MKSDFEKKEFKFFNIVIVAIYLVINLGIMIILSYVSDIFVIVMLWILFSINIISLLVLYLYSRKMIYKAYSSVDKASDMMEAIIRDNEAEIIKNNDNALEEGAIGVLYDNFGKLVNMFREAKNKEKKEKEYLMNVMQDISHQLKTPLASMNVFLDLLIENKVDSLDERNLILKETANQVNRMEWMVLAMLKLARIEAGAVEFLNEEFNLYDALSEAKSAVAYLTKERGQEVVIDSPPKIIVKGDMQWITEALINIIKNASDYSYEKSDKIDVSVEQNNIYTRIYIKDYGIGMTEEVLSHIFERFYRASNEVNPNSVGIGLSLSKSIIEKQDGRITVNSKVNEGTVFTIQLNK
ncbi:MAG: HAMP domain-containing histidine kinase [Eubacterium sp.]|nr:HAMP domain-containing histidine kinase [Eubacterium sp.]